MNESIVTSSVPASGTLPTLLNVCPFLESIFFFVFLISLAACYAYVTRGGQHHELALKLVLVLAVVGGVVFVCLLQIPKEYVTAVVGLLGTVAGFVLGKKSE